MKHLSSLSNLSQCVMPKAWRLLLILFFCSAFAPLSTAWGADPDCSDSEWLYLIPYNNGESNEFGIGLQLYGNAAPCSLIVERWKKLFCKIVCIYQK